MPAAPEARHSSLVTALIDVGQKMSAGSEMMFNWRNELKASIVDKGLSENHDIKTNCFLSKKNAKRSQKRGK